MKRQLPPSSDPDVRRRVKASVSAFRERLAEARALRRPRPVSRSINRSRGREPEMSLTGPAR
jgi:hypothetical protein